MAINKIGHAMHDRVLSSVLFHDHIPNYSSQNHSDSSRRAFTLHISESGADWSEKNWLQKPDLGVFKL